MSSTADTSPPPNQDVPAAEAQFEVHNKGSHGDEAPARDSNEPDADLNTSQDVSPSPLRAVIAQGQNESATSANASVPGNVQAGTGGSDASAPTPLSTDAAVAQVTPQPNHAPQNASTPLVSASELQSLDASMAESATYGTRSRNRGGNARPNYAEDQDMDFEYSSAAPAKEGASKKNQPAAATPPGQNFEVKRAQDFAKLIAVNGSGTASANASPGAKEPIPGTSTFSANPSRKRKAAGTSATVSQPAANTNANSMPAARRQGVSPASSSARETNIMIFTKQKSVLNKKGELTADDGTKLSVNDHVYLVCEPPGDPYYLCRIMEFLHVDSDNPSSPVDSMRVNWYYRPRDVQRFNSDSRLLYGTMHSDLCPLTSLRGKCIIKHRSEIEDLDAYRKERDSFYFVQIFDRFIRRWYECIPTSQIINVPEKVKKALDERWKFVAVEVGRVKELTSAVKTCKRCTRYCATNDSVDCAICKNSYHMNCVQPPLPKKPSRGFAWACGPCSRASEKKLEARNTPTLSQPATDAEEEEIPEEEVPAESNDTTRAPTPNESDMQIDQHPATQAEIALAKMWPMRYLGIHCRVEDALQYDDRAIYPRASSRLGPRHQANVNVWHGRPIELVKPAEIKKRYIKNATHKKEGKLSKETLVALEADRQERATRPKWVQDEPPGYVPRGDDYDNKDPRNTARLMFKMPPIGEHSERGMDDKPSPIGREQEIDNYVTRAKYLSRSIGVPPFGTNFLDKALELLTNNNYNVEAALKQLQKVDRVKDLHEPVLSKAELIKFEEGVAKYGSEHRLIRLHMKTNLPNADIVRFYYLWKKTPKGKEIWGSYGGRKGTKRKLETDAASKLQDEVAHDADDSAFDNDKAAKKHRGFQCKYCSTTQSRQWRRAPGVAPGQTVPADGKSGSKDKNSRLLLALCLRCAGLWRKYAIQWEDIDEVSKKVSQGGGRAWKKRIDEELLRELIIANEAANLGPPEPASVMQSVEQSGEPAKKKSKIDKDAPTPAVEPPKKIDKPAPPPKLPTPPPPPIIPELPRQKILPCAVCKTLDDTITCDHCKLTVHRRCYGLKDDEGTRPNGETKWVCEQCYNDRNPTVSTEYACCLCLTEETFIDLIEPPRVSHKKKTDREREKERLEKELAEAERARYRSQQVAQNRPTMPREPLKQTAGNNWVHVYCAVWTPEIRFSDAKSLAKAEGMGLIPLSRLEAVCKLCKNKDHQGRTRENAGACVTCHQCHANFHASCAFEAGYQFGFDVTPVKGSRKDQITTATLGEETGSLTAAVWCKEHAIKSIIHPINEVADETGKTALQVFVENYKQADLTLTGTVRKANLVSQLTKAMGQQPTAPAPGANRKVSTANSIADAVRRGARTSSVAETKTDETDGMTEIADIPEAALERRCIKCNMDVTPKWHLVDRPAPEPSKVSSPRPALSPSQRRLSMTLGELADMERERPTDLNRTASTADITGAPITDRPSEQPRQQNIRFMAPGASGRAWEGMPDRLGSRPSQNGIADSTERPSEMADWHRDGASNTGDREQEASQQNGDHRQRPDMARAGSDDVFHTHALPKFDNPALEPTPPPVPSPPPVSNSPAEYLCHKCFLKKQRDPTPPPAEKPAPMSISPPRQFPLQLGWNGPAAAPAPAPAQPAAEAPPRGPWDDAGRQQPPTTNGVVTSPNFTPHVPPPQPTYQFGQTQVPQPQQQQQQQQQPNGYHGASNGPPSIPGRTPTFSYSAQPSQAPPAYPTHGVHRPPQLTGFPPVTQSIPNGVHSPHGSHRPLQSPTYMHGPQNVPQHQFQPPRYTDPAFNAPQLPPISQPLNGQHGSPHTPFARAENVNGPHRSPSAPFARPASVNGRHASPTAPFARRESVNGSATGPHHAEAGNSQMTSPTANNARPDGEVARPATPRDSNMNGTADHRGTVGASASPNLRNLIH